MDKIIVAPSQNALISEIITDQTPIIEQLQSKKAAWAYEVWDHHFARRKSNEMMIPNKIRPLVCSSSLMYYLAIKTGLNFADETPNNRAIVYLLEQDQSGGYLLPNDLVLPAGH